MIFSNTFRIVFRIVFSFFFFGILCRSKYFFAGSSFCRCAALSNAILAQITWLRGGFQRVGWPRLSIITRYSALRLRGYELRVRQSSA